VKRKAKNKPKTLKDPETGEVYKEGDIKVIDGK